MRNKTSTPPGQIHKAIIQRLIERCQAARQAARQAGLSPDEVRARRLAAEIDQALREITPQEFIDWIKDDREYSFFYYDLQQRGACAKPAEIVALILESIALEALD